MKRNTTIIRTMEKYLMQPKQVLLSICKGVEKMTAQRNDTSLIELYKIKETSQRLFEDEMINFAANATSFMLDINQGRSMLLFKATSEIAFDSNHLLLKKDYILFNSGYQSLPIAT